MTKKVVVARSSESVESVRRLMVQHKISRIVLVNELTKPVGIITDKDLLRQTLTEDSEQSLEEIIAAAMMSKPLVKLPEETSVSSCAKRMLENAISSVVIVRGDSLTGIVTKTDMCTFYSLRSAGEGVEKRMTRKPITARASQKIVLAARIMGENHISRLPVVDNQLDGIITLSDLTAINPALSPAIVSAKGRMLSVKGKAVLQPRFTLSPWATS